MATIKAVVTKVQEFNNAKDIKLVLDSTFKTLKEGAEFETNSINFQNVELQIQLKELNPLMTLIEIKCMGHRCKPELFKMLLEGAEIEFELILHKAEESFRHNGMQCTFDYNETIIKNVVFPELKPIVQKALIEEVKFPKLEKPELNSNELLSLLYNK